MAKKREQSGTLDLFSVAAPAASHTEDESRKEIAHYKRGFPREVDFNLVQYGNMLIYYGDIRAMYARHGYKSIDRMSDARVWETYKRQVGYVARTI